MVDHTNQIHSIQAWQYQPFFDAAYPDTYTETMRRKEARAAARRVKDDESTVITHQSLPPAPAPAG